MKNAFIVSYARIPIGKSHRGAFNNTHGATLGACSIRHAVERSTLEPRFIEDVIFGCALPEGATGENIARQSAIRAGLPVETAGMTVNRFCASGLEAVAIAAQRIQTGNANILVAGGVESLSLVENKHMNRYRAHEEWILANKPDLYLPMIDTAEIVAKRYGISREDQDLYAVQSQERTAQAQQAGLFDDEIVPLRTTKIVIDKATGEQHEEPVELLSDEGNRPGTNIEKLSELKPAASEQGTITAGNASQISDGSAALVLMSEEEVNKRNIEPLGVFRGIAISGCEPDEMGIGPVFAVPKLLQQTGLSIDDIDLWELNEAFAVQVVYCRDRLGIPNEKLNVNGGAISIGHPYGMSGARMVGHALLEGKRRKAKYAVITMCIGGGMGAAGLVEIL